MDNSSAKQIDQVSAGSSREPSRKNSVRGSSMINLEDLIKYLVVASRQNELVRVRSKWLDDSICQEIERVWPEGPSILISHLVYSIHYYCQSAQYLMEMIEDVIRRASKLDGELSKLVPCHWPFILLDRLVRERGDWIKETEKLAFLPSRIHRLASETYVLEKQTSTNDPIDNPVLNTLPTRKISPLVGLTAGLDSSFIPDPNSLTKLNKTNELEFESEAREEWNQKCKVYSHYMMGYVAELISLLKMDQLTGWTKSAQMAAKEVAIGLNKITISIVYKLLKLPNPPERAKVIIFLIESASYCYKVRDHTSSFLITSSLENSTIQGLVKSWKLVPKELVDQLKSISKLLGINQYDNFSSYFRNIYPSEETALSEIGLINIVVVLSRIPHLKEQLIELDGMISLTQLRSIGHFFLPMYRWSATNQLNRPFAELSISAKDERAICLFASPYANLTERMLIDYMTIRERQESMIKQISVIDPVNFTARAVAGPPIVNLSFEGDQDSGESSKSSGGLVIQFSPGRKLRALFGRRKSQTSSPEITGRTCLAMEKSAPQPSPEISGQTCLAMENSDSQASAKEKELVEAKEPNPPSGDEKTDKAVLMAYPSFHNTSEQKSKIVPLSSSEVQLVSGLAGETVLQQVCELTQGTSPQQAEPLIIDSPEEPTQIPTKVPIVKIQTKNIEPEEPATKGNSTGEPPALPPTMVGCLFGGCKEEKDNQKVCCQNPVQPAPETAEKSSGNIVGLELGVGGAELKIDLPSVFLDDSKDPDDQKPEDTFQEIDNLEVAVDIMDSISPQTGSQSKLELEAEAESDTLPLPPPPPVPAPVLQANVNLVPVQVKKRRRIRLTRFIPSFFLRVRRKGDSTN